MTREITNNDDIIDSRDVTERIADLEAEHERDDDEQDELDALRRLAAEGKSLPDWPYSAGLIRDSYFEDHARDLAEDIGAIPADASWPATCIDWERAARELRMDYTSIDFDGVTYWSR